MNLPGNHRSRRNIIYILGAWLGLRTSRMRQRLRAARADLDAAVAQLRS